MSPESTPEAARLHAPGNFPRLRGRRFPSAPRAPRARGSGRAAGAAAAASSRPRLRRAASSLRPARPPGSLPSWQAPAAAAAAAADGEGVRRPRGVGDEAREVSSGRSSVRPPARPLTLLPQHHGGAERLARARPASSAGGPGDSGGGGGPGGRDISTGPGSGGARSSGPGSSSGSSLGPGSSGGRLAHLQRRVRASGGYRSVRRVLRGRSRPGAETGREWVRDAVFPACLPPGGRAAGFGAYRF